MPAPVTVVSTLEFAYKHDRAVDLPRTIAGVIRRAPAYARSLTALGALVRRVRPNVVINFYEPLVGVWASLTRHRPPVIAVGHQFMQEHPDFVRLDADRAQQWGLKWYTRLVGAGSTRLALSHYEVPDRPQRDLIVCPPLLRRRLFDLVPEADGKFTLVYMVNHGYAEPLLKWHEAHPDTAIHCFYDKPGAPSEEQYDDTLTFHQLDGEKFLRMMAACRNVVCTAGFESVCEAGYLGKPLLLVPVEDHIEQQLNALDAVKAGLGVWDPKFDLDRLAELPDRLENPKYRAWVRRAPDVLLWALERATDGARKDIGVVRGSGLVGYDSAGSDREWSAATTSAVAVDQLLSPKAPSLSTSPEPRTTPVS
jgi:uncharacterized protein (TIGR00661 family)